METRAIKIGYWPGTLRAIHVEVPPGHPPRLTKLLIHDAAAAVIQHCGRLSWQAVALLNASDRERPQLVERLARPVKALSTGRWDDRTATYIK